MPGDAENPAITPRAPLRMPPSRVQVALICCHGSRNVMSSVAQLTFQRSVVRWVDNHSVEPLSHDTQIMMMQKQLRSPDQLPYYVRAACRARLEDRASRLACVISAKRGMRSAAAR